MENAPAKMDYGMVNFEETAMDAQAVAKQVNTIQLIMEKVMKKDEHFGVIPGCKKPSLYKPGAEKISLTFRLRPEYDTIMRELKGGHREYEIKCTLYHIPSGQSIGQGLGSCTTMEGKYRYRTGDVVPTGKAVPQEYWTDRDQKLIGGKGFSVKKIDGKYEIVQAGEKVEHDNPADYYNTVLKMAKKRAHIDAILTATAASDIFTQDIEEPLENGNQGPPAPPIQKPKKQAPTDGKATEPQINAITNILMAQGAGDEMAICEHVSEMLGKEEIITSLGGLTKQEASSVITALNEQ